MPMKQMTDWPTYKQEVLLLVLRYVLQHGNVWEIHESVILAVVTLFDVYREIDAYLADMAQLSNHAVDAAELRTTGDNIGKVILRKIT